ncbi:hypothetical protein WN943_003826 [Citrus x changshan-huyou]
MESRPSTSSSARLTVLFHAYVHHLNLQVLILFSPPLSHLAPRGCPSRVEDRPIVALVGKNHIELEKIRYLQLQKTNPIVALIVTVISSLYDRTACVSLCYVGDAPMYPDPD